MTKQNETQGGWKRNKRAYRARKQKKRKDEGETEKGEEGGGNNYLKSPFCRLPLGTFILSRKTSVDPHTPFLCLSVSFQHPQLNTALVCTSMRSTSHYLWKQLLIQGETRRKERWEGQRYRIRERRSEEPEIMPSGCVYEKRENSGRININCVSQGRGDFNRI